MSSLDEIRQERLRKLELLKERGYEAYPADATRTHTIAELTTEFENLAAEETAVTAVGRVMIIRGQGSILFADFQDATGRFQAVFKEDEITQEAFALFSDTVDNGDFIQVTGTLFTTKTGQQSLLVKEWRMLTKSILPLPDKHHGLKDEEERFRKRYLDLLQNEELRTMFLRKERFWGATRTFLKEHGFTEVETPTLEVTTGGAEARPFKTHHNDFDIDLYLRISVGELWQKRLMAAGFEKTFEIGRVYRNEGTSPEHLQEFTNFEFYWAYADYKDGMELVEEMIKTVVQKTFGTLQFSVRGFDIDLSAPWPRIDYVTEVKRQTGIDVLTASEADMQAALDKLGVSYEGTNRERLTDTLWKYCRKNIGGPAFLVNHPKIVSPLSKASDEDDTKTQRFQPLLAGSEVGNGYSELNDPIDQKERFETQRALLEAGDEEAMMPDDEFIEMLEHGIPPTCGFSYGERLFAILEDRPLRETQLFPLMRPK